MKKMDYCPNTKLLACLLILSSIAATVVDARETPLRCMSCKMVLHLATCENIETCNENQVCYVEEVSALGGEINYNAGCRDKEDCDSRGCFGEVSERVRRESSLHGGERTKFREGGVWEHKTYCHHCCDSDFCNMYGCSDDFPVGALKGSRCFSCKQVESPETCQVITNCNENEICFMEEFNLYNSETRFNTGCMKKQMCDILDRLALSNRRRRNVRLWSDCCNDHLCNRQNPAVEGAPSRLSIDYKCPNAFPTDNENKDQAKTTVATTPLRKTTAIPETVELCEDERDCSIYGDICVGIYAPWAKIHCPKYCGFCKEPITEPVITTQATPLTTVEHCKDDDSCNSYTKDYICIGEYVPWSKLHCPNYCGFCKEASTLPVVTTQAPRLTHPPETVELCEDEHVCSLYDKGSICIGIYEAWSRIHCPKYCEFCTGESSQSQRHQSSRSELVHRAAQTMRDSSECVDLEDCSIYGRNYVCAEDYRPWAIVNCPEYCGLCHLTTPPPTTPPVVPCKDTEDCSIYGHAYICAPDYVTWATVHCPVYCGLCPKSTTPPTTTPPEVCEDDEPDCDIYGREYICTPDYVPWATIHCAAYCGICTPASTSVSTTRAATSASTTVPTAHASTITSQKPSTIISTTTTAATTTQKQTTAATTTVPLTSTESFTTSTATTIPPSTVTTQTTTSTQQPSTTTRKPATTSTPTTSTPTTTTERLTTTTSTTLPPITTDRSTTTTSTPVPTTTASTTLPPTMTERSTTTVSTAVPTTTASTTLPPTTTERLTITASTAVPTTTASTTLPPTMTERLTTTASTPVPSTTASTTLPPITTDRSTTTTSTPVPTTTASTTLPPTTTERSTTTASTAVPATTASTTLPPTTTERSTTTATTTILPTTTSAGSSCSDKQDCSHFDIATLCNSADDKLWMYENCRASCSWCDAPPPCVDTLTNCAQFGDVLCTQPAYASIKGSCKATCKLC